jgi:hypothetical protein
LLTTSSPTFGQASLGTWTPYPGFAWFGAAGQNNATNGNSGFLQFFGSGEIFMCAPTGAGANIQYNGNNLITVGASGVSMPNSTGLTVAGLITANGGITGNLTGTASNASALGGVAADYFVQGSNSTRTTLLTGAVTSQSQLFKSGFYCSQTWTDVPVASTWVHLIHSQYANDNGSSNGWSFDIAANFAGTVGNGEHYYMRTIHDGTALDWRELIHSTNYPSFNNFTSGLTTTTLTASGLITANGGITGNLTGHASLDLPLSGGTMNAGAKILTNKDMTISTSPNINYLNAPFVAQRATSDSTTTTHASIGFHNIGVNAAALFYHAGYSNFWFNDHLGGVYQLWSSKDFASQAITNWTTAYNWGNHASAGYLTSTVAASTYQPLDSDLTSWAGITRASGFDTFVATPSSANLAALLTDEVGSGELVFKSYVDDKIDYNLRIYSALGSSIKAQTEPIQYINQNFNPPANNPVIAYYFFALGNSTIDHKTSHVWNVSLVSATIVFATMIAAIADIRSMNNETQFFSFLIQPEKDSSKQLSPTPYFKNSTQIEFIYTMRF